MKDSVRGLSNPAAESAYHLRQVSLHGRACAGLACFAARNDAPQRWLQAHGNTPPLVCLGQCYSAPAASGDDQPLHIECRARQPVLLSHLVQGGARSLQRYTELGGGQALQIALTSVPAALIAQIEASGLRGRGGAGFPTGRKWLAVAAADAQHRYVVANADEGDAGSFSDRFLLEDDPFRLIEGMIIAGLAVDASEGYLYLRKEYPDARAIVSRALAEARSAGWLGTSVLGSGRRFELSLVEGQGSYVCGEETALLNSIEQRRPEVRPRPPQITEFGLYGQPTLVNNVETLCAVPWIITHGPAAYAAMGDADSRGTKLLSLNSLFRHPGLYEIEFGMPLRTVVDTLGGGLRRGNLLGVMVGGPLAGLVPPDLLDTPFEHTALESIGCSVGHGGIIAFSDDTRVAEIVAEVFRFGAGESCGKCTPCHLGSPELARLAREVVEGGQINRQRWQDLIAALQYTSLCGFGRGLADFALAIERHYPHWLD